MVETESSAARTGSRTGTCVHVDQRARAVSRAERRVHPIAGDDVQTENLLIIVERPFEIADVQSHGAETRLGRKVIGGRRNAVRHLLIRLCHIAPIRPETTAPRTRGPARETASVATSALIVVNYLTCF